MQREELTVDQPKGQRTTEEVIFQAAVDTFLTKGYDGTRMQDIADAAMLNKALLHYYFRSKEDLFKKVLRQLMSQFVEMISSTILSEKSTESVLSEISAQYTIFYKDKSELPLFIINTMHKYPELVISVLDKANVRHIAHALMGNKGSNTAMSERDIVLWFVSFISLKMMPLIGQNLFKCILNMDDEEYQNILVDQSEYALQLLEN